LTIGGGVFDPHSFAHSHSHTPASLIIHHYCIRHGNFAFLGPHVSLRNITKEGLGQDTHMGVVHVVFVERKGGWAEEYLNAKESSIVFLLLSRVCVAFYIPLEPLVVIKLLWESTVDSLFSQSSIVKLLHSSKARINKHPLIHTLFTPTP
jgi:hypothetical protein